MKCPRCGSEHVAEILYGMPAFDDDLKQKLDKKEVYLGGCCISEISPRYHCNNCKKDFGSAPLFFGKDGQEDYRDAITSVCFSDGGFFHGHIQITIERADAGIRAEVFPRFSVESIPFAVTEEEWRDLLDALYGKLFLHEWKKNFDDPDILDGEQWSLRLGLNGGRRRLYHGSNDYPQYWDELKALFRPFFNTAGVEME